MYFKNLSYLNRKGPRYVRQKDNYSCPAFALLNADKWLGQKVTFKALSEYKKKLNISRTNCATLLSLFSHFKKEGIEYIQAPKLKVIDKVLESNGALHIYCNEKDESGGHLFLVVKKTKKGYKCVNLYKGSTINFVSRKQMFSLLRRKNKRTGVTSYAWPIYKKEIKKNATV